MFFDDDYQPIVQPNSRGKVRQPGGKDLKSLMDCKDLEFVDFIGVSELVTVRNASSGKWQTGSLQNKHFHTHLSRRQSQS